MFNLTDIHTSHNEMNAVLYTGLKILTRHLGYLEWGRTSPNRLHTVFEKVFFRSEDIDATAADNPIELITTTVTVKE